MSLLLASFNELPVVEPLERQWLTDQVARLGLGFGFFFFGHGVYIQYLTRYRQYKAEMKRWEEEKERRRRRTGGAAETKWPLWV